MRGVTNAAPASGLKVIAEGSGSTRGSAQVDLPSPAKLVVVTAASRSDSATRTDVVLVMPGYTLFANGTNAVSLSSDGETLSLEYGDSSGSLSYEYLALG